MPRSSIVNVLKPWNLRQQRQAERLAALRARDGDNCARCRRPVRFDLPKGHDKGATIEEIQPNGAGRLENLCLTHRRCNLAGADHTVEVTERMRRKSEAALFARSSGNAIKAA